MKLVEYDLSYWDAIQDYQVMNAGYTGIPKEIVRNPLPQRKILLGIDEGTIRTFFVLDTSEDKSIYGGGESSLLLRSFSTDSRYLRQGFARKTLNLLVDFVRQEFPAVSQIVLGVNVRNQAAIACYTSAGFLDSGKRVMGKLGQQIVLHWDLKG